MFAKVKKFLNDVYQELQKVAWPSRDELIGSTIVVIFMSVIVAVFIGIVDWSVNQVVHILIKVVGG
ncbi:MAG: preprotein translocase subunit SecE [candidate division Zixibacteria bacterium RBG_16_53_22]|nr:MAG: preprotein translocase subunit SecE [candidate division Zixibacteria bacterium RBG_16_53_22]